MNQKQTILFWSCFTCQYGTLLTNLEKLHKNPKKNPYHYIILQGVMGF